VCSKVGAISQDLSARRAHLQSVRFIADLFFVDFEQLLLLRDIRQQYQKLGEHVLEGTSTHDHATVRVILFSLAGSSAEKPTHVAKFVDLFLLHEHTVQFRHQARVSFLKIWW